jgi:nicotinamidase/pyrazinamidase
MESVELNRVDALLLVDVQNDFLPGGSLAVAAGDEVIPPLNAAIEAFASQALPVIATRDWHPPRHCSFEAQGGIWPPHCIAGTNGADFSAQLRLPPGAIVISKGTHAQADAYSGFDGTALAARLQSLGVQRLFVGGLATDYCVLHTVNDALMLGLGVVLLSDAVRAVDVRAGDGQAAIDKMAARGALLRASSDIAQPAPA